MNHLKWPVPVCFHRLPERRQPAVHELHKVSQYSFIGFVKEGIAVYVHTLELLVALGVHLLLGTDYDDSEAGTLQARRFLPHTPIKRYRQVLDDDQYVACSSDKLLPPLSGFAALDPRDRSRQLQYLKGIRQLLGNGVQREPDRNRLNLQVTEPIIEKDAE